MLFVVTHRHVPDKCMADDPAPLEMLLSEAHVEESGVRVVGDYIAPPEHAIFLIVEAGEYAQVVRFLRPIMTVGEHDIIPVQSISDAMTAISSR